MGGGVNQKRTTTDGGGRPLNRTSTSEDFEQLFCVSDSEDTPPPRPQLSGSQNLLCFRVFTRVFTRLRTFTRDTGRTSEDGFFFLQTDDVRQGGSKKSVFARTSLMDDP